MRSKLYMPVVCSSVPRLPYTLSKKSAGVQKQVAEFHLATFKPWGTIKKDKDKLNWECFLKYIRRLASDQVSFRERETIMNMNSGLRVSNRKKRMLNMYRTCGVIPWVDEPAVIRQR